jgi:hypothetical protein
MAFSGMLHRAALVRTDVSEELSTSFIRVTRIGELGTTLVVTSNRRTLFDGQDQRPLQCISLLGYFTYFEKIKEAYHLTWLCLYMHPPSTPKI